MRPPPEPLQTLLSGISADSKHFLRHILGYNNAFQMTSFGATQIVSHGYMPTFKVKRGHNRETEPRQYGKRNKREGESNIHNDICMHTSTFPSTQNQPVEQIQGQIYHRTGSLLPLPDADHEFLQIYFIGDNDQEADRRCVVARHTRRNIIVQIQEMLHQNNELVRTFKTAIDRMPTDNHQIVIRPDKAPPTEHARRFNAPTIDDVAIVIVGDQFRQRDIVLQRRNDQLLRVHETHRSYDSLQYPLMFPRGEDGYYVTINMVNPATGELSIDNIHSGTLAHSAHAQTYTHAASL